MKVLREERTEAVGGTEESLFTEDRRGRLGDRRKATDVGTTGSYRALLASISLRGLGVQPHLLLVTHSKD